MLRSTLLLAAIVAGLGAGAGTAQARACRHVTAGRAMFTHVAAHTGVTYRSALRAPRHGERRAIARAVRRSPYTRGLRGKFTVRDVRVSTVDRRWGRALLRPKR